MDTKEKPGSHGDGIAGSIDAISAAVDNCVAFLTVAKPEEKHLSQCKKSAVKAMAEIKGATRLIGGLLEQTKEERVTTDLNGLTYLLDDMFRRIAPAENESLLSALSMDNVERARIVVEALKRDVGNLRMVGERLEGRI